MGDEKSKVTGNDQFPKFYNCKGFIPEGIRNHKISMNTPRFVLEW